MLAGFANSGSWVGNIIGLPLAGYLCINGFNGGWPSIFYIFGIVCLIWSVLFFFICSDTPETHRFISDAEKNYILQELNKVSRKQQRSTPWLKLLTTKACISIYVAHFCSNFGIYLFLTQLPTFLKDVLKFDIKSNGFVSALPYVASCVLNILSSLVSDKLIQSGRISRTNARKLLGGIGKQVFYRAC
jgi:ACS family sodium-dependent inorganic phosphate cotransporter-like MFS transporter 5